MLQIEIYIIIPDSRFPLCFSNAIQLHTYQHMYSYFTLLLIFHILPLSASFITNLGNPKPHYVGKKFKTNHQKNKHKNKKKQKSEEKTRIHACQCCSKSMAPQLHISLWSKWTSLIHNKLGICIMHKTKLKQQMPSHLHINQFFNLLNSLMPKTWRPLLLSGLVSLNHRTDEENTIKKQNEYWITEGQVRDIAIGTFLKHVLEKRG